MRVLDAQRHRLHDGWYSPVSVGGMKRRMRQAGPLIADQLRANPERISQEQAGGHQRFGDRPIRRDATEEHGIVVVVRNARACGLAVACPAMPIHVIVVTRITTGQVEVGTCVMAGRLAMCVPVRHWLPKKAERQQKIRNEAKHQKPD